MLLSCLLIASQTSAPELTADELANLPRIGLARFGNESVGIGPGYRVSVTDGSGELRVTPELGRGQAEAASLGLELLELSRGGVRVAVGDTATVTELSRGLEVRHPGGVSERVDLLSDGAKHSVVLDAPLGGGGDLVARFALDARGLSAATAAGADESLRFETGAGGLRLGRVLGVDADGREAFGSAAVEGGELVLRLPAEFVDGASYPLELDPLIGAFSTTGSAQTDRSSDLAYCASTDSYLLVYTVEYSATDTDTYAQRLDSGGAPIGGAIIMDGTISPVTINARVAADSDNGVFGVVWERFDGLAEWLEVTGVRASDGGIGAVVDAIEVGSGVAYFPDIGSQADNGRMLVVFRGPLGTIAGALIEIDSAGDVTGVVTTLGTFTFEISTGFLDFRPRVSERPSDSNNRWLVGWERFFSTPAPGDNDVYVASVDSAGNVPFTDTPLWFNIGTEDKAPSIVTTGQDSFVIAAAIEQAPLADIYDIEAATVTSGVFGPTFGTPVAWTSTPTIDERHPSLAFNGACVAATCQTLINGIAGPILDIQYGGFSPDTLVAWDGFSPIFQAGDQTEPTIASTWPDSSTCLLATTSLDTGALAADIGLQSFRPAAGAVTPLLDGACGPDLTTAFGAFAGNPAFEVTLLSGAGPVTNLLFISQSRVDLPCGSCLLVPNPFMGTSVVVPGTPFLFTITATLPIPLAAAGRTFFLQWLTVGNVPPNCPELGLDLQAPIELFVD